jgi:hypothetical protein
VPGQIRRQLRRWQHRAEAHLGAAGLQRPFFGGAVLHPGHFARAGIVDDGFNINGPTVISVPTWVKSRAHPSARYYMYFSHHEGAYVRLAWAASLGGPWTLYNCGHDRVEGRSGRGAFDLDQLSEDRRKMQSGLRLGSDTTWRGMHVASPDVHIDGQRFIMYVHMPVIGGEQAQMTFALHSRDGLRFELARHPDNADLVGLGPAYFRVFTYHNRRYAVSPGGHVHAAKQGWGEAEAWQTGPRLFAVPCGLPRWPNGGFKEAWVARHLAVEVKGDVLTVYLSRAGDAPERILAADVALGGPWRAWKAGPMREIHRAQEAWQGAAFEAQSSAGGIASGGVNQVRDPYLFTDDSGRRTLFFTVQGERAIASRTLS